MQHVQLCPIGYRGKIVGLTHFHKCCLHATALNIYNHQHTNISTLSRYKPVLFYTELYPVSVLNFLTVRALHITDGWMGTCIPTSSLTEEKNLHHRDMHKMLVLCGLPTKLSSSCGQHGVCRLPVVESSIWPANHYDNQKSRIPNQDTNGPPVPVSG